MFDLTIDQLVYLTNNTHLQEMKQKFKQKYGLLGVDLRKKTLLVVLKKQKYRAPAIKFLEGRLGHLIFPDNSECQYRLLVLTDKQLDKLVRKFERFAVDVAKPGCGLSIDSGFVLLKTPANNSSFVKLHHSLEKRLGVLVCEWVLHRTTNN